MNSLKRYIAMILVFAAVLSLFVVPAAATEIETENDTGLLHCDLLSSSSYSILTDSDEVVSTAPFARFNRNTDKQIQMTWDVTNSKKFDKVIFAVSTFYQPATVTFCGYTADYIDRIDYVHSNDIYFYSVSLTKVIPSQIDILFDYENPYTGLIGLYSCVGLLDTARSISSVDIYRNDKYLVSTGYELSEGDPVKDKTLPYTFSSFGDNNGFWGSDFRIVVDGNDFVSPLVTDVSLLVTTCVQDISSTVSLIAKGSNGSNVTNLKHSFVADKAWSLSGDYMETAGMFEAYASYQVNVDLSGFDMSKYDLMFSLDVRTIDTVYPSKEPYLDLSVRSISYIPFVENTPWYKSFFSPFFDGIQMKLANIYNAILDAIGSVNDNFRNLFAKLEEYFGDDGALSEAGEQMSEQAGQMNEANDSLNSVDKPVLDTDSMFTGILDFNTGGLTILSCMTGNVYVTQVLIVVFTFALCGYVFFGKRG